MVEVSYNLAPGINQRHTVSRSLISQLRKQVQIKVSVGNTRSQRKSPTLQRETKVTQPTKAACLDSALLHQGVHPQGRRADHLRGDK